MLRGAMRGTGHTVLVVDDHVDVLESLEAIFAYDGYTVETATNGREALDKLRDGVRPCAILLDLMMPVMDGFEFRRQQLADARLAEIPVIAISAAANPDQLGDLRPAAFLSKPADPSRITELVDALCRQSASPG